MSAFLVETKRPALKGVATIAGPFVPKREVETSTSCCQYLLYSRGGGCVTSQTLTIGKSRVKSALMPAIYDHFRAQNGYVMVKQLNRDGSGYASQHGQRLRCPYSRDGAYPVRTLKPYQPIHTPLHGGRG